MSALLDALCLHDCRSPTGFWKMKRYELLQSFNKPCPVQSSAFEETFLCHHLSYEPFHQIIEDDRDTAKSDISDDIVEIPHFEFDEKEWNVYPV